jgi:hypothetical protein
MKIGEKMEVTREFFAPVIIKIDRITELDVLVKVLEAAIDEHEVGSPDYETLADMSDALSEAGL